MRDWRWVMDHCRPLRVIPQRLPAECWNPVRLVLQRRGGPLRLELDGLRGVQCELRDPAWFAWAMVPEVCPLLVWTDFDNRREALDAPVACRLYLYHYHAGLVSGRALDAIRDQARALHRQRRPWRDQQ